MLFYYKGLNETYTIKKDFKYKKGLKRFNSTLIKNVGN